MLASWQTEVNSKNKLQGYTKGKSKKVKNSYIKRRRSGLN